MVPGCVNRDVFSPATDMKHQSDNIVNTSPVIVVQHLTVQQVLLQLLGQSGLNDTLLSI